MPITGWLPQYDWNGQFLTDALAGLSVTVLLIPQALAYSTMAGLTPKAGLLTAFFPALIYIILGSSRQMSVGPESTSAILLGHVLSKVLSEREPLLSPTSETYALLADEIAFKVTFLAGCICLLMGLARTGFVDSILSQPVLEGFVCSIALLLITDQVPKLLGLPLGDLSPEAQGLEKWTHTFNHITDLHGPTTIISIAALATLLGFKWLKRAYPRHATLQAFPDLFVVLVIATGLSSWFDFAGKGVAVLGQIESGFRMPRVPTLTASEIASLGSSALSIAILGFVDSGLVSKLYAQRRGYFVSSNRELVALGASNVVGSMFGAFPGYGSLTRTKLADSNGARSQISNLVTTILVGLVTIWFLPSFASMPKAVISTMILLVAFSLLDLSSLKFLFQLGDTKDASLYLSMVFLTFFFGVDVGLLFAFVACLLMLVKQTNVPQIALLGRTPTNEYADIRDSSYLATKLKDIFLIKIGGSIHFANSATLKSSIERMESFGDLRAHPASRPQSYWSGEAGTRRVVIFDFTDTTTADSTAIHLLLDMMKQYASRDIMVLLVLRSATLADRLLAAGSGTYVNGVYRTVKAAVQVAEEYRQHGNRQQHASGYESFTNMQHAEST